MSLDTPTLLLLSIAIIEGFVGVLQLIQMIGTRVGVLKVTRILNSFENPDNRITMWKEAAHGVMRAFQERQGALKGAATRQIDASIAESGDFGAAAAAGLMEILPKKYKWVAPLIAPQVQGYVEQAVAKLGNRFPASQQQQQQGGQGLP